MRETTFREKYREIRYSVTEGGFPTLTISKIPKDVKFYAERNTAIVSSPIADNGIKRRRLMLTELQGEEYTIPHRATLIGQAYAQFKVGTKQTMDRKRIGERSYVLYEAIRDEQKVSFRSCFPGTILCWNASPMGENERYFYNGQSGSNSVWNTNEEFRPKGTLYAIRGSFLVAELTVQAKVYHQEGDSQRDVLVKRFSETDNSFQKFSGQGYVFLECHGDLREIPLYPGEQVDVWPGYLLGFTEGVTLQMKPAGDVTLRNEENNDYVIRLTAPEKGGYVYAQSMSMKDFFRIFEGRK